MASNQSSIHEAIGNSRAGLGANHKVQAAIGRNIYKYINKNKFKAVLAQAKKSRKDKQTISQIRKTFKKVFNSAEFQDILKHDFTDDLISHVGLSEIVAQTTNGIGIDEKNLGIPQSMLDAFSDKAPKSNDAVNNEFKQVLLPLLQGSLEINDNWLLKALSGLDKDFTDLLDEFSKKDRASEAVGTGINYLTETLSDAALNRITVNAKRSALANKDALIKTLSQNLLNLSFNDQKAFRNLHQILEASIYGHTGTIVIPKRVTATVDRMTAFANLAMGIALPDTLKNKINAKTTQAKRGLTNIIETATNTQIVRTPDINTLNQAEDYVVYYFSEASVKNQGMDAFRSLNNGNAIDLRQLDADELIKVSRQWHANINKGVSVGAGALSGAIAFFQLQAVIASVPQIARLKYAGDSLVLTEAQLGTISSGLALVTASMDVTATGAHLLTKTNFANKLIYTAGWIGLIGATFEVGSLAIYGYRKYNDGNSATAKYAFYAGVSISASAIAGVLYGYGAISTSTGGLAAIPGAALLGVMLVGLALSYTFQRLAYKFDDKQNTLIEYWLDNGVFGRHAMRTDDYYLLNPFQPSPPFNSLQADLSGFVSATTAFIATNRLQTFRGKVPVEYKAETSSDIRLPPVFGSMQEHLTLFESEILVGNWDKASQLSIDVVADINGSEQPLYKATFYHSASGQPSASNITSSAINKLAPIVSQGESDDQFVIDTQLLKFEPRHINRAKVIVSYIPDSSQNPVYPLTSISYLDNNKY